MKLKVIRNKFTDKQTLGTLQVNGFDFCYTCEDAYRGGEKIKGQTCINPGTYKVALSFSNRFKKYLPEVLNVPNFSGIRIHSGNTHEDTEGCLLIGMVQTETGVAQSKNAMIKLMALLKSVEKTEPITIEYIHL